MFQDKIFLLGMTGAGKSTLGKQLAEYYHTEFVDLDEAISEKLDMSIPAIFESEGEAFFRQIESSTLRDICESKSSFVMATGGGAPCHHDNIELINNYGKSVFIDVPIDTIVNRFRSWSLNERPLFAGLGELGMKRKLQNHISERLPFYEMASIRTAGSNISLSDIVRLLPSQE